MLLGCLFSPNGGNVMLILFCVLFLSWLSTQRPGEFCLEEKDPVFVAWSSLLAHGRETSSHQPERKQLWWQMLVALIIPGLFAFRFPRQSWFFEVSLVWRVSSGLEGDNKPPPCRMHFICFLHLLHKHTDKGHSPATCRPGHRSVWL